MEFLIGLVLGVIITISINAYRYHRTTNEILTAAVEALETIKEKVVMAKIEVENNKLFMYDRKSGQFLATGNTMEEIEKKLKLDYPGKFFDVNQDELDTARAISILNTQLSEEKTDNGKTSITSNT
jgi:hypothetical protein